MSINIIVLAMVVFACGFMALWLGSSKLREKIERPKYEFQDKVRAFDEQAQASQVGKIGEKGITNES